MIGQDQGFPDRQPAEAHDQCEDEPSDPADRDVAGPGDIDDDGAHQRQTRDTRTPGPQRVRRKHQQDKQYRYGPYRVLSECDRRNDGDRGDN